MELLATPNPDADTEVARDLERLMVEPGHRDSWLKDWGIAK